MIYEERSGLNDLESTLLSDNKNTTNHIIWVYLDPVDKKLCAFEPQYREEAYRNMVDFYTIKDIESIIIFDNNDNHMQVPLKYYTNGIYDERDLRSIKRLIVGGNEKDIDVYIYMNIILIIKLDIKFLI